MSVLLTGVGGKGIRVATPLTFDSVMLQLADSLRGRWAIGLHFNTTGHVSVGESKPPATFVVAHQSNNLPKREGNRPFNLQLQCSTSTSRPDKGPSPFVC